MHITHIFNVPFISPQQLVEFIVQHVKIKIPYRDSAEKDVCLNHRNIQDDSMDSCLLIKKKRPENNQGLKIHPRFPRRHHYNPKMKSHICGCFRCWLYFYKRKNRVTDETDFGIYRLNWIAVNWFIFLIVIKVPY